MRDYEADDHSEDNSHHSEDLEAFLRNNEQYFEQSLFLFQLERQNESDNTAKQRLQLTETMKNFRLKSNQANQCFV